MDAVHFIAVPPNVKDITGVRSGRLVVIGYAGVYERNKASLWECRCDCGETRVKRSTDIVSGAAKSCGCLRRESSGAACKRRAKYDTGGLGGTPEYHVWWNMLKRCYDPSVDSYSRYGGRGISVCDRWRKSCVNFVADMGRRPSAKHQLDRKDNNGNYEPGNCRWATLKQQGRNQSTNVHLEYQGQRLCISEWSERTGISERAIAFRRKAGWAVSDILTTPMRVTHRRECPS